MSATASFPVETVTVRSHRMLMALIVTVLAVAVGAGIYLALGALSGTADAATYPWGTGSPLEECLNTVGRTVC